VDGHGGGNGMGCGVVCGMGVDSDSVGISGVRGVSGMLAWARVPEWVATAAVVPAGMAVHLDS
jgi:hypothetical protein